MASKNNIFILNFFLLLLIFFTAEKTIAACTSPAAVAGAREWFSAEKKYKYCNGTSWVAMQNGGLQTVATISGTAYANFSGATNAVVSGTYAYIVGAQKFTVVSITTPASPTLVKTTTNANFGSYTAVYGNYAFVSGSNMITVLDITDKNNPTVAGSLIDATNLAGISSLKVKGSYLYVGATTRLTIVNISAPTSPSVEGSVLDAIKLAGNKDMDFSGNYVVVSASTYDGIAIVDVTNKSSPTVAGSYTNSSKMDAIAAVRVYGNYAYTAGTNSDTLGVVDITNKTAPTYVVGMTTTDHFENIRSLAIKNDRLFVGSDPGGSSENNMVTMDLTLPASPVVLTENNQGYGYDPTSLSLDGDILIALSNIGGNVLLVFDISSKPIYQQQKTIYMRNSAWLGDIAVSGTLAVGVSSDETVYVFDVTTPSSILARGTAYMPGYTNRYSDGIAFDGTYAYVSEVNSQRIFIVDVATNPNYPQIIGTTGYHGNLSQVYDIQVVGNYAYTAGGMGLTIVDISNKLSPTYVGNVAITGSPRYVKVSGNYAYVTAGAESKITVVDITNKAAPTIASNLVDATNLASVKDISISGNYAYVAATGRLTTVNISTPTSPTVASSLTHANFTNASRVRVNGSSVYLLGNSLCSISITLPASPTYSGVVSTDAGGNGALAVNGSAIFTATSTGFRSYSTAATPVLLNTNQGPNQFGNVGTITASGSYAFVASNSSFYSVNISTPTSPSIVSTLTDGVKLSSVQRSAISGTRVFAVGSGYATAVSISTPTSPTITGNLADATNLASAKAIKVIGSYAFVAGNKLSVLNVSGANPVHVTSITHAMLSGCADMAHVGNYLYLTCSPTNSFLVIDISTPTSPSVAGVYTGGSISSLTSSMVVTNNTAYISRSSVVGAVMLDVSNPAAPSFIGYSNSCTALIASTNANRIYCRDSGVMYTLDVSTPAAPAVIYSTSVDGYFEEGVTLGNLVLSFVQGGLHVGTFATTSLMGPVKKRLGGDVVLNSARGIDVVGNYAYVSTANNYLNIFNIANIASATLVSSVFLGDSQQYYTSPYDLVVAGNYLYIAGTQMYGSLVIDISNPALPKSVDNVSSFPEWQNNTYMKAYGNYIYGTGNGFIVHNITSPTATVEMDGITDATNLSGPQGFDFSGNHAFICASGNQRLTAVNISNKSSLGVSGSIQDTTKFAGCRGVVVSGTLAYMTGLTNGYLNIIDISNPVSMTLVGSLQNTASFGGSTYYDMAISGTTVVVANASNLTTVDVGVPASPTIIETMPLSGSPNFTKISGDKIFVTHNTADKVGVYSFAPPVSLGSCTVASQMDYDTTNKAFKFCSGTNYYGMTPNGAGGAGCSSPTGKPGALDYFSATNVYKYCDGTSWIQVGN